MNRILFPALAGSLFWAAAAVADPHAPEPDAAGSMPEPVAVTTNHSVRIGGERVDYSATVGWMIQKKDDEPVARFGYTAYFRDTDDPAIERPILFAFNGGPGSSSIWLHMGILGPQRVVVEDPAFAPPPPARRVDNEFSVLDLTDIVMIDPVGTGFSRPVGEAEGKDFWGVDQDIESVARFIRDFVREHGRWGSPKFILGESYGGIRGAGLAHHLQTFHNMHLNGLILVSPFLSEHAGRDGHGMELPHALFLPSFAATAWYHDSLEQRPDGLDAFLEEVEEFAMNEYLPALVRGHAIEADRKRALAERLGAYTGTTADYWERADLLVDHQQFLQEMERGSRRIAGRIDSRYIGPSTNPLAEEMDYDPFFPAVGPAFTAAFFDYLYEDLEFRRGEEYKVSAWPLDWDWTHRPPSGGAQPAVNLLPDLAMAMTTNPGLGLYIQQGIYDIATPYLATRYYIDQLDVPAEARERIRYDEYPAGHMMYLHPESLRAYREDLAEFIRERLE
ncbi:MAG: hypothetical protein R3323_02560 [Wenzhouxiangellaceae bacterium]|nr:hypothetical protein [Wenzhouxiangellaceae bacterium]